MQKLFTILILTAATVLLAGCPSGDDAPPADAAPAAEEAPAEVSACAAYSACCSDYASSLGSLDGMEGLVAQTKELCEQIGALSAAEGGEAICGQSLDGMRKAMDMYQET